MRHARSCSTLHCMHDLSQGTLTITIKDRDIRQRSTSPTSRPHLVPNAPTVVPMSLRYHSALRSSQKLFQTRRHSLQECASAQFKLDAKARRATLESPIASSSSLSLSIRRSHSTHLLFPGLEDIFLFNVKFLPAAFPLTLPCGA